MVGKGDVKLRPIPFLPINTEISRMKLMRALPTEQSDVCTGNYVNWYNLEECV